MKNIKQDIILIVNAIFVIITAGYNLVGYLRLPDKMATQISFSGDMVNTMPKEAYLGLSLLIVILLAVSSRRGEKERRIKNTVINAVVVIANIVMITIQL